MFCLVEGIALVRRVQTTLPSPDFECFGPSPQLVSNPAKPLTTILLCPPPPAPMYRKNCTNSNKSTKRKTSVYFPLWENEIYLTIGQGKTIINLTAGKGSPDRFINVNRV